ncbi:MAG: hypothetical protein AB7O24_10620 [Kofleriaceae bacterium]
MELWITTLVALFGCSNSTDNEEKPSTAPQSASPVPNPAPAFSEPPPPAPKPKPAFDRPTLLAALDSISGRCIESAPAVQFLSDNVVRIQYVHGCGQFEKPDAGAVMWQILQRGVSLATEASVEMPTFKIHAFTRNGSSLFTSITTPKDITRLLSKDIGFDDWLVRIGEGAKKLAAGRSESEYLKTLPEPPAGAKVPDGDEIKTDLTAYIEDLECAKEVSKLIPGKVVTIGYKEVCGHFEDSDVRLTMYEIALRMISQFDKHGVWAGLKITARADNGGDVFTQNVPAQVLQGIKDRQIGIVDWVMRAYPDGSRPSRAAARRDCHEGEGCVLLPEQYRGTSAYLECQSCCYGVSRDGVGMYPYSCKGQGE